nr:hypothetical protein [Halalkalibacter urbisdiaboli]
MYDYSKIQDDIIAEQLSLLEYIDPFTGEEVKKNRRKNKVERGPLGLASKSSTHGEPFSGPLGSGQ